MDIRQLNKKAVIAIVVAAVAFVIGVVVVAGLEGGNTTVPSESQIQTNLNWTCNVTYEGYQLTFENPTVENIEVTGFSVGFLSNGVEDGSDNEPGNGLISDADTQGLTQVISMNDWVMAGQTFTYYVQLPYMPSANACKLLTWSGA